MRTNANTVSRRRQQDTISISTTIQTESLHVDGTKLVNVTAKTHCGQEEFFLGVLKGYTINLLMRCQIVTSRTVPQLAFIASLDSRPTWDII